MTDNFTNSQHIRKHVVATEAGVVASQHRRAADVGAAVLADWPVSAEAFVRVMPTDYQRVLNVMRDAEAAGLDEETTLAKVMEASRG